MRGLGRQFNAVTSATTAAVRVSLKDWGAVSIICIGATSGTVTITEANAASGGTSQAWGLNASIAGFTTYFTQSAAGLWTKVTQAAGNTLTMVAGGLAIVDLDARSMSYGFSFVAASHASASFVLLPYDPEVARKPENLRAAIL